MSEFRSLVQSRRDELAVSLARHQSFQQDDVVAQIRRNRRRSTLLTTAASIATMAAVGLVGLLAAHQLDDDVPAYPPPPPSPSASPSPPAPPTPTPTPTPVPTPPPNPPASDFTGEVTSSPHLPSAAPLTLELWESATSGWVLVPYREHWQVTDTGQFSAGPHALYLVSPQGDRYELTTLSSDDAFDVLWWAPGSTTATVAQRRLDPFTGTPLNDVETVGVLDLTTGDYFPQPQPVGPRLVHIDTTMLTHRGAPLWRTVETRQGVLTFTGGPGGVLVPGGLPMSNDDIESIVATVSLSEPDKECWEAGAASGNELLVSCYQQVMVAPDNDCPDGLRECRFDHTSIYAAGLDTPPRLLYANTPSTDRLQPQAVVDGQLLGYAVDANSPTGCSVGLAAVVGGNARVIVGPQDTSHPGADRVRVIGFSGLDVYATATSACWEEVTPAVLLRIDLTTNAITELVPYPAPLDGSALVQSVNGAYVVP